MNLEDELAECKRTITALTAERDQARARVGELDTALRAQMRWSGPPPTDGPNYDQERIEAWRQGMRALGLHHRAHIEPCA